MSTNPVPHDLHPPLTALLGFFFEGPLYGLNAALYICCARVMLQDFHDVRKRILLALATLQLIFATVHVIVFFIFLKRGFIDHGNTPQGPANYLANTSSAIYAAQLFFYMTNNFIADGIMAWRCYVVWSYNNYIGAFYTTTVLGTAMAGYSAIGHIRLQSKASKVDIFAAAQWMTAMFALSIVTQVAATSLIAIRLWRSRTSLSTREHMKVIWMIVESGAILTASTLAVFVLYLLDFNTGQVVTEIAAQLGCMIPTSIIVRVGMKRTQSLGKNNIRRANSAILLESSGDTAIPESTKSGYDTSNTFMITDSRPQGDSNSFASNPSPPLKSGDV